MSAMVQVPIVTTSVAVLATGLVGYAIYFDYSRRASPEYRRDLRRQERRQERLARDQAEAEQTRERQELLEMVREAKRETPVEPEQIQGYIMEQLMQGETYMASGADLKMAALCFYKALRASDNRETLAQALEQNLPKSIISHLARFVAADDSFDDSGRKGVGINLSDMPTPLPD